jgi:hypothetical protein
MVWILTVFLIGTTIEFSEPKPFYSHKDCRDEGQRQVQDYQMGGVRAGYTCEEVTPPPCEADYCI